ncbi:hypothetical protein HMPREF3232_00800 [Fannyhessea vaginae]|nr:hypothetical protein HMPREF3232_00800 [Fannyhessea vaginae]
MSIKLSPYLTLRYCRHEVNQLCWPIVTYILSLNDNDFLFKSIL